MLAQGKQPRALREIVPCEIGLRHALPRLRSPGLRMAESAQSPERAQQMADQPDTDSQTRTSHDQNECRTASRRVVDRAPLRGAAGNRRIGPWRLLRPFRAVENV
jgi:hypothetical protein